MKPRHKRLALIVAGLALLSVAVGLVLTALGGNINFSYTPSQVANHEVPRDRPFRIGGLVETGSLVRNQGLAVSFRVTDTVRTVQVEYTGILPDLFHEGRGVVALGTVDGAGVMHASEVLPKHDENYMPPEAARALKAAGKPLSGELYVGDTAAGTAAPGTATPLVRQ